MRSQGKAVRRSRKDSDKAVEGQGPDSVAPLPHLSSAWSAEDNIMSSTAAICTAETQRKAEKSAQPGWQRQRLVQEVVRPPSLASDSPATSSFRVPQSVPPPAAPRACGADIAVPAAIGRLGGVHELVKNKNTSRTSTSEGAGQRRVIIPITTIKQYHKHLALASAHPRRDSKRQLLADSRVG